MLLLEDGTVKVKHTPAILPEVLLKEAGQVLAKRSASFKNYTPGAQNYTVFTEYLQPPVSLVIIGAGNDVVPLVNMAEILGWQTTVIDGRSTHVKTGRFMPGCQVILSKPENALEQIAVDRQTAFLLMTHNYNYDLAMLRALLGANVPYIGSLGPKKKLTRMLGELANEGFMAGTTALQALRGPAGLDIGAETPEEIALSILAEIKAFFSNCSGEPLHNQPGAIHPRNTSVIQQVNI
jgi:xanthine/CO dehydrogenase XdhC/CoxF family maturation factor